ncbi:MAG: hypothetical protein MJ000_02980 [Bacteroidales bacterium]|nr:hypothetical protein [Bacteroidales bacterium]
MRTPRLILSIVCMLCAARLHAQDISINLSIRWEDAPYIFNSDSIVSSPRLVLSYSNESNRDLYFLKIPREKHNLPGFPCGQLVNCIVYIEPDYTATKSQIWFDNYYGEEFIVELSFSRSPDECWWVLPKCLKENLKYGEENKYRCPEIDCTLSYITDFIMKKIHTEWSDTLSTQYLCVVDTIDDISLTEDEKIFCFLRSGETKEDVYDINALWMAKGIFEFVIAKKLSGVVIVDGNANNPSGVIYPTAKLPKKVGDYQLYSGEFKCNPLTITF